MELKDFIVLTLAGGLGCWALSLMQIFWGGDSPVPGSQRGESDSEPTPRGDK